MQCAAVVFLKAQACDVRELALLPLPADGHTAAGALVGVDAAWLVLYIGRTALRLRMRGRHPTSAYMAHMGACPAMQRDPGFAAELAAARAVRGGSLAIAAALSNVDRHTFLLRAATANALAGGRRQAWLCAEFVCHNPGCFAFAAVGAGAGTWSGGTCGACFCAWYCSTACQRQHWKRSHRDVCGAAARKLRVCHRHGCPKPAAKGLCDGCGVARYCGAACQRQHWKQHKPLCPKLAAWRAARRSKV